MNRTLKQDRAISWYCQTNNFKPQLSTHPVYFFKDSEGNKIEVHLSVIVHEYERAQNEERQNKRRRA